MFYEQHEILMKLFFLLIQVDRRYNFVYPEFTSILRKYTESIL